MNSAAKPCGCAAALSEFFQGATTDPRPPASAVPGLQAPRSSAPRTQPAFDSGSGPFQRQIDRDMQQRAGRRDLQAILAELCDDGFEPIEHRLRSARQMLRPSMTPSKSTDIRKNRRGVDDQARAPGRDPGRRREAPARFRGCRKPAKIGRQHDLELRRLWRFLYRRGSAAPAAATISRSAPNMAATSICTRSAPIGRPVRRRKTSMLTGKQLDRAASAGGVRHPALHSFFERDRPRPVPGSLIAQREGSPTYSWIGFPEARAKLLILSVRPPCSGSWRPTISSSPGRHAVRRYAHDPHGRIRRHAIRLRRHAPWQSRLQRHRATLPAIGVRDSPTMTAVSSTWSSKQKSFDGIP